MSPVPTSSFTRLCQGILILTGVEWAQLDALHLHLPSALTWLRQSSDLKMTSLPTKFTLSRYPFPGSSAQQTPELPPEECRLSLPFSTRISTSIIVSSLGGFGLGFPHGARTAGLRFRAENAHRLPTTPNGWYTYYRSKNYYVLQAGVREGVKMGTKCGFWVGGFFAAEEAVDRLRGHEDFLSTVVAGLGVAGVFTLWSMYMTIIVVQSSPRKTSLSKAGRFPLPVATKTARSGLIFGLAFGLMQDALTLGKGQRVAYVDYLLGRSGQSELTAQEGPLRDLKPTGLYQIT